MARNRILELAEQHK
jgi:hypothetical protein